MGGTGAATHLLCRRFAGPPTILSSIPRQHRRLQDHEIQIRESGMSRGLRGKGLQVIGALLLLSERRRPRGDQREEFFLFGACVLKLTKW